MNINIRAMTPRQRKMAAIIFSAVAFVLLISNPLVGIVIVLVGGYWVYRSKKYSKQTVETVQENQQSATSNVVATDDVNENNHKGNAGLVTNFNDDFKELLRSYKANKPNWELDAKRLIKEKFQKARPDMCPYCEKFFDFVAKRARKCPQCGENMVVRQGYFLSKEQVEVFEKSSQIYFDKQSAISDLERNLKQAQDYKFQQDTVGMNRYLAEAFRAAAKFANTKDSKGYSYWDRAWRYYNTARIEEMKHIDKGMLQWSKLPEMMFEMSQMIIDQSRYDSLSRKDKLLINALGCMFSAIAESIKFGDDTPYFTTQLYQEAKKIIDGQSLSDAIVGEISTRIANQYQLSGRTQRVFEGHVKSACSYEVIGS